MEMKSRKLTRFYGNNSEVIKLTERAAIWKVNKKNRPSFSINFLGEFQGSGNQTWRNYSHKIFTFRNCLTETCNYFDIILASVVQFFLNGKIRLRQSSTIFSTTKIQFSSTLHKKWFIGNFVEYSFSSNGWE